jgi:hypothetical protein
MYVFNVHVDYRHTADIMNQTIDRGKVPCCQLATTYIYIYIYIYILKQVPHVEIYFVSDR